MKPSRITFVRTCFAFPEQYDAYLNGIQVGYLRLRHGKFTVESPDCMDTLIYSAEPKGQGIFDEDERDQYLYEAEQAILNHLTETNGDFTNEELAKARHLLQQSIKALPESEQPYVDGNTYDGNIEPILRTIVKLLKL